jgi:aminoglycoside phosphotransferase family enzyme/predicted kinase
MHRARNPVSSLDTRLIDALMHPDAFDYQVTRIDLEETHISWLILTDDFVYKIKKPVVLDFLDFGCLEKRKFYCEEEIRLNQPWAPGIYVDVVPVTLDGEQPRFAGSGETIEYAVRMRRFDQDMRLDRQLELEKLTVQDMRELASKIAVRHKDAPAVAPDRREKVHALTKAFMWDNFNALDGFVDSATFDALKEWTSNELGNTESLLLQRFDDGYVRDCHGDLHLANLVRLPDGITTFDCIEFNEDFRHIDVMCDIAFLIMDLVERRRHDLAAHFLNRYLEATGDYSGVALLSLFIVYRCLVRAKVAVIRSQEREDVSARDDDIDQASTYCDMALRQVADRVPVLVVMNGLSGSGKSFVAGQLMAALPAIRVRSDIERKRMSLLNETEASGSGVGEGIYTGQISADVYARLFSSARIILDAGHNVILDAAFLQESDRTAALAVAEQCNCPSVIIEVAAAKRVMRERIRRRLDNAVDASEANLDVLEHQLEIVEALSPSERARTNSCDNTETVDVDPIVKWIREERN